MNKVAILREKVSRLVTVLTEKKVKVTQRGAVARVEYNHTTGMPSVVNLPYIPEDADDEFIGAVEGFLDHEVAKVLFSDYSAIRTVKGTKMEAIFNVFEDSFIERKMREQFRGSGANLETVGSFYLSKVTDKNLKNDPVNATKYLMAPMVRALAGQSIYEEYMDDKWPLVEGVMNKAGDFLRREIPKIESSADTLRVVTEFKRLMEEDSGEGGEGENEDDSGEDDPSGEQSEKGEKGEKGKKDKKSKDKDKGEEGEEGEDGESEGEGSKGSEGDGEDGEDGDGESEGEPGGDGESEGEGGSPASAEADEGSDPGENNGEGQQVTASWRDVEDASKFDEELSEELTNKSSKEIKETDYPIYSKDFDFIGEVDIKDICIWDDSLIKRIENAVDHMVGPMQKEIERIIAARSRAHWSYGHRSGKLNAGALARMVAFKDERVFRRRHEGITNDVAISLLIDCSGSMGMDGKIEVAAQAAYGLASVLDRIKIPFEILGFTTNGTLPHDANVQANKLGIDWGRYDTLYMPVFKPFKARFGTDHRKKLAGLSRAKFMSSNIDGECVQNAADRLMQQKAERKILIVLSDGLPAGHGRGDVLRGHLKTTVKRVEDSGIEVFGIGIADHSVSQFYPKYVVIRDVNELPTVVVGKMKEFLL